jgi:hypothetical protein
MNEDDVYDYLEKKGKLKKEKEYKEIKIKKQRRRRLYKLLNSKKITVIKKEDKVLEEEVYQYEINKEKIKNRKKELIKSIDYNNNNKYIDDLIKKYEKELEGYKFINGGDIKNILIGGYIRYINLEGELKYGGILIKKKDEDKISKTIFILKNTNKKVWKVSYKKNYIFYKKHTTINDKFRDLFISSLNGNI